jgi:hypothetical protein
MQVNKRIKYQLLNKDRIRRTVKGRVIKSMITDEPIKPSQNDGIPSYARTTGGGDKND